MREADSVLRREHVARELERHTQVKAGDWLNSLMALENMELVLSTFNTLEEACRVSERRLAACKETLRRAGEKPRLGLDCIECGATQDMSSHYKDCPLLPEVKDDDDGNQAP